MGKILADEMIPDLLIENVILYITILIQDKENLKVPQGRRKTSTKLKS